MTPPFRPSPASAPPAPRGCGGDRCASGRDAWPLHHIRHDGVFCRLYRPDGPYWYASGFNPIALVALALGIAPCVPGFLGTIKAVEVAPIWTAMYHYAWFIGFGISAAVHFALMRATAPSRPA